MSGEQGLYILLHTSSAFRRGICLGTEVLTETCGVKLSPGMTRGFFLSKIYDSRESGMEWHRLCMDTGQIANSSLTVSVYTCDSERQLEEVREVFLEAGKLSLEPSGKADAFERQLQPKWKPYLARTFTGRNDVLLPEVTGRYLWMVFDFRRYYEETPVISEVRVEFPRRSYLEYLPEVYRQDPGSADFLHRFLSVFQKMDEEMEAAIDSVPLRMDPCCAGRDYLEWIAELIGMESYGIWNDEQLRDLIRRAPELYKIRGTKAYLETLIEKYCNRKPVILTYQECKAHKDITCSSPYEFVLLLPEPEKMNTDIYQDLLRIIETAKPAWMECRLILLRPYCFLDENSYIGMNTVLGQYRPAALNDESMIPYATLEGGEGSDTDDVLPM